MQQKGAFYRRNRVGHDRGDYYIISLARAQLYRNVVRMPGITSVNTARQHSTAATTSRTVHSTGQSTLKSNTTIRAVSPCKNKIHAGTNRPAWRSECRVAVGEFEKNRTAAAMEKRAVRKDGVPLPNAAFACSKCSKTCLSRNGLQSHERRHARRDAPPS